MREDRPGREHRGVYKPNSGRKKPTSPTRDRWGLTGSFVGTTVDFHLPHKWKREPLKRICGIEV